ncbi:MAG TPA: class II aldolase/adducin family protein [Burkholderiales bacterium]|nr:class II aldolase/adducin family protein [Burkholderiales bacterium]
MSEPRSAAVAALIEDLVAANRILAHYGVLDGFGHVSARHPERPDRFLLSCSRAPELVSPADIMEFDLDSNPVGGDARRPYLERFIHGEVYRARQEVQAVVHSHSPSVIPFAASSVRLRPVYHMGSFLSGGAPVFDIRKHFGCTDMLVRNREQGAALAAELDDQAVVLMRGHGFVAVADSVPIAVYRAIYTEMNAGIQQKAIALGGTVTYLEPDEAARSDETNRGVSERPWELWKRQVLGAGRKP